MRITPASRISQILKSRQNALDVMISISPHFKKLKNPILRKTIASRVTLKHAATISKIPLPQILERLEAAGFDIDWEQFREITGEQEEETLKLQEIAALPKISLDVRTDIEEGNDPFQLIMTALKDLPDGHVLALINSFKPKPLIHILSQKGYSYCTVQKKQDLLITYFLKTGNELGNLATEKKPSTDTFGEIIEKYAANMREVDVRHMEMPGPMMAILEELEKLPRKMALFVHHKKIPQFLIPELDSRNYRYAFHEIDEFNVKMIIYHDEHTTQA